ncbi:MAG: gluconate 2-dehydrogenase subunit 3 family protein [Thermoleophilaceae bacterium]
MGPPELPRHRRGVAPQGRSRFPDHDVLSQARHWDETTRKLVVDRVDNVPSIEFFTASEERALRAFCDVVMAQDSEPRIPVLEYIDEKLARGERDGYRYFMLPDDDELWRLVARGLDNQARAAGADDYAGATLQTQQLIVEHFSQAKLHGEPWSSVNVAFAWEIVHRDILNAFYAHPWAWNEIGFGGPAYPRGYSRFGSPHLPNSERETWEGREAVSYDPGFMREGE